MKRFVKILGLALLIALPACADAELDPAPSPVLEGPELSMPHEPRKTADPPPPVREHRLDTSPQSSQQMIFITGQSEVAPVPSSTPATTGTVNAVDRSRP